MFRSKEFQRSVMPLIIINSIFCTGLLEYFANWIIRIIGFAYVISCFVFYNISFFTLKSMLGNYIESLESELIKIIIICQYFNNDFIYLIVIFNGLTRRKLIKLFIEQMEICTRGMDELKVPENYSSLSRYQCIVGVFLSFVILGLYLGEVLSLYEAKLYIDNYLILMIYCVYFNPLIVMTITDFTFLFWIRYIKIKFVQLNAVLQSMLTTTIDSPQHKRVLKMKDNWEDDSSLSTHYGTYKAYENLAKLKRVKQIHLELMKCASILNEAYGLQILISIFSSVTYITTTFYNLYFTFFINKYHNWIKELYVHFYYILYYGIKVFALTNICQTTITERCKYILIFLIFFLYAVNTGEILYELYEPSTSKKFREEVGNNFYLYLIRDFMYQSIQNRLKFTVCGFYDLDHTLIYSVIGSIITYLVILLQVGDKPKLLFNNAIHNLTSRM
ncbi:putative gustatory receptor 28b [Vespula maculifrons]|uniref:Gustatory receptor n=1 Tax=Vespula maculifrons TaxID=7453 RepID=A0ABD2CNX4_VESMC